MPGNRVPTETHRRRALCGRIVIAIAVALSATSHALASERRSHAVASEFQHEHPCPSTGSRAGRAQDIGNDHIVPLACGGPDAVSNLQWQTIADARAKDAWERRGCSP